MRKRQPLIIGITLAALSSFPAIAELPSHQTVVQLRPTPVESGELIDPEFPFPRSPNFGAAVAIRNGIAFVGIPYAVPSSRVGVYNQTSSGWVRTLTLTVPDAIPDVGSVNNGFGSAITFRDGLAVIASFTFVHVFRRTNGVWTDIQKLAPPPKDDPAVFNFWEISALRYENGILAIGSSSFFREGVVYVYELAGTGKLVKRATLRASDGSASFGRDVGIAGNTLVVGDSNAAHVFKRRSDGTWVKTQKLIAGDSRGGDFGAAVAIDRGMIIVGAPWQECLGGPTGLYCPGHYAPDGSGSGGAAYGFVPIAGQYTQMFRLRPRSDEHFNYWQFGRKIAMFDKHVVIDAAEQDAVGDPVFSSFPNGLSFTYRREGSILTARGITSGYVESNSIGLANNWLMVGAVNDPDGLCQSSAPACFGEASIFDLNRFAE